MSNIPNPALNERDLESLSPEAVNKLFSEVFGDDTFFPDWASALANGTLSPSAQLCTRDGRVTGNAVLMWWTIVSGMPAAVVATDAGNVIVASKDEVDEKFFPPNYLMSTPLDAHLDGVVAAGIEIPDEFRFLFEDVDASLDEEEEEDIDGNDNFILEITDSVGDTMTTPFDTVEELNEFLTRMGIPIQF